MKQALVILAIVAAVSAAKTGGLRARFGVSLNSFYTLPQTVSAAKDDGWTLRTRAESLPYQSLVMYCPSPATLCTLYDDTEYIAGIQIALDVSRFQPVVDMEINGFTNWTTDDGTYYASTEYFAPEDYYSTAANTRVSARNPKTMLQTDAVWVTGTRNQLFRIPRDMKEIGNTNFTEQSCIPAMGMHYYYAMSSDTKCDAEGLFPFFGLYDDGELVGIGFNAFGAYSETGKRKWFEWTPKFAVKSTIHQGPKCLYDLTSSPGAQTLHTYFIKHPSRITCLDHLLNLG